MKPSTYQAPPPKWVIDISSNPVAARPAGKIPDPPGFGSRGGSGNKVYIYFLLFLLPNFQPQAC